MNGATGNFVEQCLIGDALAEDIYDYIDEWHVVETDLTLPEFLGFTDEEYALWLEKPESLEFIIFSKCHQVPLVKALKMSEGVAMAARAPSQEKAEEVLAWLRKTGRIG